MKEDPRVATAPTCHRCGRPLPQGRESNAPCPACLTAAARVALGPEIGVAESWDRLADTFPHLEFHHEFAPATTSGTSVLRATTFSDRTPVAVQVFAHEAFAADLDAEVLTHRISRLAAIQHPNLARILDFGELDNGFYLITEAPDPGDAPTWEAAVDVNVINPVADALSSARSLGLTIRFDPEWAWLDDHDRLGFVPLLQAGADDHDFAGRSADGLDSSEGGSRTLESGLQLGAFRIIDKLGEGGFSEVWLAEQSEPVRRKVALKFLKVGMDTRRLLARFDAEQQALARLDHPNIARVLDAGATDWGRPFFVMEAVDGKSLTEFCEHAELSIPERLRLFMRVCEATHHAHQNGIIHRDLKPSNILVARDPDGHGIPKIIDFGIAKAVSEPLTERTIYTRDDQLLGTLEYMSPEQASRGSEEVDTGTDVYALGAILYELLAGRPPFAHTGASTESVRRQVVEEIPARPSLCAAESDPRTARQLEGDLDWIVMRCLEKEPARRYPSASALARDLERHLANEPVEAGPPQISYRIRKFAKRNSSLVVAATVVSLALVAGLLVAIAGYREARASEQEAREAESLAESRLARETAVANFVTKLFFGDSWVGQKGTTYDQLLERAVDLLDRDAFPDPTLWMYLQGDVAATFSNRGDRNRAIALFEEVEEYRRQQGLPPGNNSENLAQIYHEVGRHEEGLKLSRELYVYLRDHEDSKPSSFLAATGELLNSLWYTKRWDEASAIADEAWRQFNLLDAVDPDACKNLGYYFRNHGQYDRSIAVSKHGIAERTRKLGSTNPVTLHDSYFLALVYERAERYRAAAEVWEEMLRVVEEVPELEELMKNPVFEILSPDHLGRRLWIARAKLPRDLLSEGQEFLASGEKELARERFLLGLMWHLATNPSRCVTNPPWTGLEALLSGLDGCTLIDSASTWAAYCGIEEDAEAEAGWNQPDFNAASWQEAAAPLGYGDESLASEVWEVQPGEPKPTTVYFRKEFEVDEIGPDNLLVARIRADDGAALYLNGTEVSRLRLPDGALHAETFASSGVGGINEAQFQSLLIDRSLLKKGSNLLAAEVHQVRADSSDVIFDLELFSFPIEVGTLSEELARFDPERVIEKIREEGKGEMPPLPPGAPKLAAAQVLALSGKWQEALRMSEPALAQVDQGGESARVVARLRSHCLEALGRSEEAQKELAFGVPERSRAALPNHLDLTPHYTAYLDGRGYSEDDFDYLRLPAAALEGVIEADAFSFDVRGVVGVVHPHRRVDALLYFPNEVRGIEVNGCAGAIHLLHGAPTTTVWERHSTEHLLLGSYLITYSDGKIVELPVRTQDHDINAIYMPKATAQRLYPEGGFIPTWKGPPVSRGVYAPGFTVLYVKSWTNPRPEVPVRAIDVISSNDPEAPALMLFGITIEPVPGQNEEAQQGD